MTDTAELSHSLKKDESDIALDPISRSVMHGSMKEYIAFRLFYRADNFLQTVVV